MPRRTQSRPSSRLVNPSPSQVFFINRYQRRFQMTDTLSPDSNAVILKEREDKVNQVTMRIIRPAAGNTLQLFIKSPVLADVVEKMTPGNAPRGDYDPIYKALLLDHPDPGAREKGRVLTRPAIARITKNFIGDPSWGWDHPRSVLISNPDKLREGFTLEFKVDQPIPQDQLRRWGKMFMDGCFDIISNAKPFQMHWLMDETK